MLYLHTHIICGQRRKQIKIYLNFKRLRSKNTKQEKTKYKYHLSVRSHWQFYYSNNSKKSEYVRLSILNWTRIKRLTINPFSHFYITKKLPTTISLANMSWSYCQVSSIIKLFVSNSNVLFTTVKLLIIWCGRQYNTFYLFICKFSGSDLSCLHLVFSKFIGVKENFTLILKMIIEFNNYLHLLI